MKRKQQKWVEHGGMSRVIAVTLGFLFLGNRVGRIFTIAMALIGLQLIAPELSTSSEYPFVAAGALSRAQLAQIYRPLGPKQLITGQAWSSGGSLNLIQAVDLSLPIRGLRFVFKGRVVVGTAAYTATNPEGFLNLLPSIRVQGTNRRQGGNVTLWDGSLATLFGLRHHFAYGRADHFDVDGTLQGVPSTPYPSYFSGAVGTDDFRIVCDLPFHPFGAPEGVRPGFLMRQEEWANTVQLNFIFGTQASGDVDGALGDGAATSTTTYSSHGSGTGSPTIDVYALPAIMGPALKDQVLPGFLSRVTSPINSVLQAAGTSVELVKLQRQPTTRIFTKIGVGSTVSGITYFRTLSDTNLTQIGLLIGSNRAVRNKQDIFAHKNENIDAYGREPVQGYNVLDFISSGNPDAAYPGGFVGEGTSFSLVGDVAGVANAYGEVIQEQMIYAPTGPLYNF